MLAFAPWQQLLNGLGWCLAQIYSAVPNYALAIIILTVIIRLLLLPFGFKQIKSMQHMQALQPELKQLQKKYKNNKQKLQEEQMQLYREAGVNPLGGCLPLLLTLPFLFAMYAVIRPPLLSANLGANGQVASYQIVNNHLPEGSELFHNVSGCLSADRLAGGETDSQPQLPSEESAQPAHRSHRVHRLGLRGRHSSIAEHHSIGVESLSQWPPGRKCGVV